MKKLYDRAKYVMTGEEADLNIQALGLIIVAIIVLVGIKSFGENIRDAIKDVGSKVKGWTDKESTNLFEK